ncbi:YnfU family zinc-binding protein [Klebsiella sp. B345]|uniref:YnfU family zinc-binding protein n=1 Tax=Enterobacteriaceae TaxID=543 RepID=UPI001C2D4879
MSFFDNAVKRFRSSAGTTVRCPECRHKSRHPLSKVKNGAALMCPRCKSLFVVTP